MIYNEDVVTSQADYFGKRVLKQNEHNGGTIINEDQKYVDNLEKLSVHFR